GDVGGAGQVVVGGLIPDGFRLHLDTADGAENAHRAIEDAQGALDLRREVHVAGRVDQVDARVAPFDGDGRAVDRDALLLLQRVEVGSGVALVHVADFVLGAAEVENALRGRGFAGVHVGDDANVPQVFEHGYQA